MKSYAHWLFGIAATFNLVVGIAFLFLRSMMLPLLGFDPVSGSNILVANLVGMFVALFGYAFLLAAIDPVKYRPYISLAAIGKLLAVACAVAPWLTGAMAMKPPPLLGGDVILALLFLDYLRRTGTPST